MNPKNNDEYNTKCHFNSVLILFSRTLHSNINHMNYFGDILA